MVSNIRYMFTPNFGEDVHLTRSQLATHIYHLWHSHWCLWRWRALAVGHPPVGGVGLVISWHLEKLDQHQISSKISKSPVMVEKILLIQTCFFPISEMFFCDKVWTIFEHTWNELEVPSGMGRLVVVFPEFINANSEKGNVPISDAMVPSLQWPLLNITRLLCLINRKKTSLRVVWWQWWLIG